MLKNQSIKEVLTKDMLSVHEDQNLSDVAKIFRENAVHHVPVTKGTKVVGFISTQDLFKLIFNIDSTDQRMLDSLLDHNYTISDVMTSKLVILDEASKIKDVTKLLSDNSYHSVLIVDNKGDLTGIVTTTDLMKYFHDNIR